MSICVSEIEVEIFTLFHCFAAQAAHSSPSHTETIDSFGANGNRMCRDKIASILSGMRARRNCKMIIDDFDHTLFSSTYSMCPSPGTIYADA